MVETIAGPCSIESEEQFTAIVKFLTENNVKYIRGGIKKYRGDPETFQGIGIFDSQNFIGRLRKNHGFKFITEVFSKDDMLTFNGITDIWQIGSRNSHNTELLKETNHYDKPVLYKRGLNMSLTDWVKHSEYIMNEKIMCFRGLQSQFAEQRFLPDFYDITLLREFDHIKTNNIKVCVDISHMSCTIEKVKANYKAALSYDPEFIMLEVHNDRANALSDPDQQLNFKEFEELIKKEEY